MRRLIRLWHTVRHLRPVQVLWRLRLRAWPPRFDGRLRGGVSVAAPARPWTLLAYGEARWLGGQRWRFLNREHDLAGRGWDDQSMARLWRYNLHYFDELCRRAPDGWRGAEAGDAIRAWIDDNPPPRGTAWEPYPTSLRIVNWLKWLLAGSPPVPGMLDSLALQVRWLSRNLEHHLLGNHLWANAKALVFAGACLRTPEAEAWRARGLALLSRELDEQFLADGGHFERSPMYHALLTEDLLDLHQLSETVAGALPSALADRVQERIAPALRWLAVMSHPDGEIAFFNDCALGIAPSLAQLQDHARALGVPPDGRPLASVEYLADSGFVRAQLGDAVLLADVGSVGPSYIPGHAHAGTLSFELSLGGQRVLVNGGVSTYAVGSRRLAERATTSKNAVSLGGQSSSEIWSAFRVARRARVHDVHIEQDSNGIRIRAAHDGYRRLRGGGDVQRTWSLGPAGLTITDRVDGNLPATAHLHPHPSLRGVDDADHVVWQNGAGTELRLLAPSRIEPARSEWASGFDRRTDSPRIDLPFKRELATTLAWTTSKR